MSSSEPGRQDGLVDAVLALAGRVVEGLGSVPRVDRNLYPWRRGDDGAFRLVLDETDDTLRVFKVLEGLKGSDGFEAAVSAIEGDEVLGGHAGQLVGDAFTRTGVYSDRLLLALVMRAATHWGDEPSAAVSAYVGAIRDLLMSEVRVRRIVAPLPSGVRVHVESPCVIDAQTSLIKLSDLDIASALQIGFRFEEMPPAYGFASVGEPWGIEVRYELPAVSLAGDEDVPDELTTASREAERFAGDHLSRVIQAMRLAKAGRMSAVGRMTIADDGVLSGRSIQYTNTRFPRPPSDSYDLDEEAGERLRQILAMLEESSVSDSPALQTAIRRFSSSIERHDPQDRLVDLIISAEALFAGDSEPGDLSLRVAQRFARFLSPTTGIAVMDLFQHMKRAYGGRSKVVHALAKTSRVKREIDRALDAIDQTEELIRTGVVQALADTVERGEFAIDWNGLVLEGWREEDRRSVTTTVLNLGRARPSLSTVQRFELGGASVANAIDLRKDAQVLLDEGRFQRSAFLLYACMEELLKAHLCLGDEQEDWSEFWSRFRDHDKKLALLPEIDTGPADEVEELTNVLKHWRERCLYVEVSHPGNPLTPRGLVDPGGLNAEAIATFTRWTDQQIPQFIARLEELEPGMRGKGTLESPTGP